MLQTNLHAKELEVASAGHPHPSTWASEARHGTCERGCYVSGTVQTIVGQRGAQCTMNCMPAQLHKGCTGFMFLRGATCAGLQDALHSYMSRKCSHHFRNPNPAKTSPSADHKSDLSRKPCDSVAGVLRVMNSCRGSQLSQRKTPAPKSLIPNKVDKLQDMPGGAGNFSDSSIEKS